MEKFLPLRRGGGGGGGGSEFLGWFSKEGEGWYNGTIYPSVSFLPVLFAPPANFKKCDRGRGLRDEKQKADNWISALRGGEGESASSALLPPAAGSAGGEHCPARAPGAQTQARDLLPLVGLDGEGNLVGRRRNNNRKSRRYSKGRCRYAKKG